MSEYKRGLLGVGRGLRSALFYLSLRKYWVKNKLKRCQKQQVATPDLKTSKTISDLIIISCVLPTLLAHFRCWPGTESEVTNMVQHRSRNTVPIKEHSRLKRMDLEQTNSTS